MKLPHHSISKSPAFTMALLLFSATLAFSQQLKKDSTKVVVKDEPNDGVIKKGTYFVGSYFNFSTSNTSKTRVRGTDSESSQVKLGGNVTAGKMLSDHWGLLLNLGYTSTSNTSPQIVNGTVYNVNDSRNDLTISPAIRYYTLVSEGTYIFIQGAAMASFGTLGSDEFDRNDNLVRYNYTTNGFGVSIGPGVTYFMTKKLSTEIAIGVIGYSYSGGKDPFGNKTQTSTFQSLFYQNSVSLGFVYYW